jgi:hypothetical protein
VRARQAIGAFVVLGVVVSAAAAVRAVRPAGRPVAAVPVSVAPDPAAVVRAATAQGSRVEVAGLRTETRTVFAEPNGSMSAELAAVPVRVRRAGSWVAPDPRLVRGSDGMVRPRAAAIGLAFSAGGEAPLVSLGAPGAGLQLFWPGRLPAPRLAGDQATYAGVRPGVDLVVRAGVTGYTEQFVIRSARAARNPALAAIRLGLRTDGLALRTTAGGGLEARDRAGAVVFGAPPSRMWDASPARRTAVAGVEVGAGTLTIRPDRALLAGRGARFPIVLDPDWTSPGPAGWTSVLSGNDSPHWNGSGDPPWAQVGQCYTASGGCNGIGEAWTYFQFDTGFLAGTHILSATLDTVVVSSANCAARNHQLYLAAGQIGPGTSWGNRPGGGLLDTRSVPGVWTSCAGWQPIGFDTHASIHINDGGGVSTYFLKAVDSGDQIAWRKYDPAQTRLRVNFNRVPNPAYGVRTDPPVPAACRWCAGTPYVGGDSIRLIGQLSDNDPGELLRPEWDVYTDGVREDRDPDVWQGSGAAHDTTVDLRGKDGKTVDWYLRGWDHFDAGGWARGPGPFTVDRVAPSRDDQKPAVTARLYQADNRWHGGVGVPDTFTFTARDAPGVTPDIDHFYYGWSDPPTTKVDADALGGKASVTLTPPGDGPRDLYVQSADRADNRSQTTVHHFYVRAGNGPLARWPLDGDIADAAFLGDRNGTLAGAAGYTAGAVGSALRLDGRTGYLTAPNTLRTDAGFTVSAWVRLDSTGYARAAVSQDGTNFCGFVLWYRPDDGGRWVFGMPRSDGQYAGTDVAVSAAPAVPNTWTHLTGVYDQAAGQLRLYVNGEPAGTAARTVPSWNAAGPVRIGRTMWDGAAAADYWAGGVDEVNLYDRVLSAAEVAGAVSGDNVQSGQWSFEEGTGDGHTARNAVPDGEMMVLSGDAAFTGPGGGAVGGGLSLNTRGGTDGYAATSTPVVRTDQSFSVGAWVNLARPPTGGNTRTALSADGGVNSAFLLGYRDRASSPVWELYLPSADTGTPRPADDVIQSSVPARPNEPTQLTAVYDAPAHQVRLYVNGALAGSAARTGGFAAAGPLTVGRGRWNGAPVNPWAGVVDEVRAYSRALSAAEIQAVVSRDAVTTGTWTLDGNGADSSGRGRDATVPAAAAAGVDWTAGQANIPDQTDLAVRLDGAAGYLAAPHAVDTDRSFSVSAWAKLDRVGGYPAVVSQDGSRTSAFQLQATPDGHWAFAMFAADVDGGGAVHDRIIGAPVQAGLWAHLVGVYDAGNRQLRLYVNGALSASGGHLAAWNYPAGGLTIGRSIWNGAASDFFPGAIDDVAVYNRTLFAAEIAGLAGRDLSLVHEWRFDEPSGSNAADAVGARDGTLLGGAGHVPGRTGNAVHFDGAGGAVRTSGLDLHTDESFTVSAWVYLDRRSEPVSQYTAVSADGSTTSKFRLGHVSDVNQNFCLDGVYDDPNKCGAWIFEMPNADDGSPPLKAAVSTLPAEIVRWTHLTGVYDKAAGKIWLYVDGSRVGDGTVTNPWPSTGPLQVGRALIGGSPAQQWPGSVDDIRLYSGALDPGRVSSLVRSYPAPSDPVQLPTADAGRWRFDENTGSTAADGSGRGLTATLRGGAAWTGGRSGGAGWFDGSTGYAETAGPVLTTNRSFSVSAWVYRTAPTTGHRTVLGQDSAAGSGSSAFLLQYREETGRWAVVVPGANGGEVSSTAPAARDEWTHLAVSYDASVRQLRLYVNGELAGARTGIAIGPSAGPFTIGRARVNGTPTDYFGRGIDDVRAFGKALSGGEVRAVHDDAPAAMLDIYRFDDGTGRDYGSRKDDAVITGGVSAVPGVAGRALAFDGSTGAATAAARGLVMADSFTVSAWARLSRKDRVGTVVGQDGQRASGFVLRYQPQADRWMFGGPARDDDAAGWSYAVSAHPPALDQWTRLTGVYDRPGRQLRLYVDGELTGVRTGVDLPDVTGGLTIGRGRYRGVPADYFPGAIDEVRTEQGVPSDAEIALRAGWPAPPSGQLGRYVNAAGDHYTSWTGQPMRAGYRFEASLGQPAAAGPNTATLYACRAGTDDFSSTAAGCEGQTVVGEIGLIYQRQPANLPTLGLYRCTVGADRLDSQQADCPGATLLGYTAGYAPLARYYSTDAADHRATVHGTPPGYRPEGVLGWLPLAAGPGTQPLYSCLDGTDEFTSLDAGCEGKTVLAGAGQVYATPPAGPASALIYRCLVNGERFISRRVDCEGYQVDRPLGYVLTAAPDLPATFG